MSHDSSLQQTGAEVSVEWRIKGFFSGQINLNKSVCSPTFSLSHARWYIKIYLCGNPPNIGWVSLFLHRESSSSKVNNIGCSIGFRNSDGSEYISTELKHEFEKNTGFGWSKFIEISKLHEDKQALLQEESLVLFCTVRDTTTTSMCEKTTETASQTYSPESPLEKSFKDLLLSKGHFDTTINVQGREFLAHKPILIARSSVFACMFDHDMVEKASGAINIDDCDPEYFQDFLLFMYTGKSEIVTSANAVALYKAADKYNLEDLKEACVGCMSRDLSGDTFCDVVLVATTHNEAKLLNTATDYFIRNFGEIIRSLKWQTFLAEHHLLANELLVKFAEKSLK